jgi:large subunit ribosomal protein L30
MGSLKITLKRSYAGSTEAQRRVVRSLGLRRLNQTVVHQDSPTILGMVRKVGHMLHVEESAEDQAAQGKDN